VALHRHAEALPVAAEVGPELEAIRSRRCLLDDSDALASLTARLAAALRQGVVELHGRLVDAQERSRATLETDATWSKLDSAAQSEILERVGLAAPSPLAVATDAELRAVLDARSLSAWQADIDAVAERTTKALEEAARRLAESDTARVPTTVSIRRGTLPDEAAVQAWLQEHQAKLLGAVRNGPVIVR
jgi:hypothetical protein